VKTLLYKLDEDGDPVPCTDPIEWAVWFAQNDVARVVANTELSSGTVVSTVFIGIDASMSEEPTLWETMTFGGDYDLACARYRSRKDALVGHEMWVLVAKGEMTPIDARRLRANLSSSEAGGSVRKKEAKQS
jgi:hypothetical protein